jgi:hypothetical protein
MKVSAPCIWVLLTAAAFAQSSTPPDPAKTSAEKSLLTIPAGTSIPLSLKQASLTMSAVSITF